MIRVLRALLTALTLLAATAVPWLGSTPVASADDWCSDDPLVTVVTPAGNTFQFHITVMAQGGQHLATIKQSKVTPAISGVVPRQLASRITGSGTTGVAVAVQVPADNLGTFKTKVIASSGEYGTGTVYATAEGTGGHLLVLAFTINVP